MADTQIDMPRRDRRDVESAKNVQDAADRDLLDRFVRNKDEAAFTELVARHGGMALGVCRRVLRDSHEAEDACQATFLVLARKAATIRNKASLSCWLHGVAYHVAKNLKRNLARQKARHAALGEITPNPTACEAQWHEVQRALDEELNRLPEKF
jgi:RNA polymerase sigma factor (sigma-70 family)